MLRSRFLPTLFSAGLLFAVACSDAVAPQKQAGSISTPQPESALVTLSGTIHLSGMKAYPVVLTTSDGQDIPLAGTNANLLLSVADAGVDVRGAWNGDGGFEVGDFLVRMVNGGPVVDGVLVSLDPFITDDGPIAYAIRPTSGAALIMLTDPPADLLAHLNERLWVTGVEDGQGPIAFGVIAEKM
jgi:hypothetical protein